MPTTKFDDAGWLHPSRLPLGGGWHGQCSAPGHESAELTSDELRDGCNLGYAKSCARLPQARMCDAVRFSVARDRGSFVLLCYVCESGHRPVTHGTLEYDVALAQWTVAHSDPRIQRMAECFLATYLLRRIQPPPAGSVLSVNS